MIPKSVLLGTVLLLAVGCKSIGPKTIPRDRFDYSGALARSWKNQMLLNLVKTRYLDLPIYLEVGQIVSGYTLETGVSISGQVSPQAMRGDTFGGAGASGTFTDRPTITYVPLTGDKFLEGFLTPIHPTKIFSLLRSGYPADFVLTLAAESLNGRRNEPVGLRLRRKSDPEFFQAASLITDLQDSGAIGVRVDQPTNGTSELVFFFRPEPAGEAQDHVEELRRLLELDEQHSEFRVVHSPLRGGAGEMSISTRSLLQCMGALALGVKIPEAHHERRLAPPLAEEPSEDQLLLRIHSGPKPPEDSFVAVPYEGAWFWIANDDWKSKRTFSSILFLFTLADSGESARLPVITIPAQ